MTLPSPEAKFSGSGGSSAGSRFALELFVILCLAVGYYYLVRNFASGVENNCTNSAVFTACSQSNYHLDKLYDVWKGRLSGMLLSGALFDLSVKDYSYQTEQYAMLFGLYHAFWLLVLMLLMLVAVRHSLPVNLGIFAGLLCNFAPSAGFYFYPWDLPATVFLTLAVLLHERGHRVLMLAAICAGCFFKETVLVGAILCLFNRGWKWRRRLLSFVGLVACYILGKCYLIEALHLKTAVLAMGDSTNVGQLLRADYLLRNLKLLFSDKAAQVLLANAGTLAAVLVLGWERRFRPYLWMIVAYVAGQFMYGEFNEVRIFMQVLPLSCLILSECAQDWPRRSATAAALSPSGTNSDQQGRKGKNRMKTTKPMAGKDMPARTESAWACRRSDQGLIVMAVVLMVISSIAVAWDYYALRISMGTEHQTQVSAEWRAKAERGEAAAQYALGNCYYRGLGVATNWPEAFYWFRKAAEEGHPGAQLTLGLRYLRGEGTEQNPAASIPWFRKAALQGNQKTRFYLDYIEGFGVERNRVAHFQSLAWLGPLALMAAGLITVVGMVRKRKSFFDPALVMALVLAMGTLGWRWRYGGIETLWQSAIARDHNGYMARQNLGYALLQTGQVDQALACFRKAVELDPDDIDAHYNLGIALAQNGRLDEAISHFRKAVELKPDDAEACFNLGGALAQKGQLNGAIDSFQKAVEFDPNYADAHNNLGNVLLRSGQSDGAIRQYREALRLKPDFAEASNNLAVALSQRETAPSKHPPRQNPEH